jgi:hypothetical protein
MSVFFIFSHSPFDVGRSMFDVRCSFFPVDTGQKQLRSCHEITFTSNADDRNQNVSRKDAKAQRDFLVFYRENTPPSP